jgi:hypothetical protein
MTGTPRRYSKLLLGLTMVGLLLVLVPASASAQATRTWVSGVGDDANPCSRTAPCKTFAGAISKTAAKGEINCIDGGGFGGVTITKSLTIDCEGSWEGGVLVSGTNAIVINAAATDKVRLVGLDINGIGTGLNGVRVLQAKSVKLYRVKIFGFVRNALDVAASNSGAKVQVSQSAFEDNTGNGVLVAPPAGGNASVSVRDSVIRDNGCGVAATSHGPDPAFNFGSNCGTLVSGAAGVAKLHVIENSLNDNGNAGVFTNGPNAIARIGGNEITGNANGLSSIDLGVGGGIFSYGGNYIGGNTVNGSPNGGIPPT